MDDLQELARSFLDRRTAVSMLSSVSSKGRPETTLLVAARFTGDGTLAGGEEDAVGGATFRNLRQNPIASLLVLDPVSDPRARDGVRILLEFLGAETDGDELARLDAWLQSFAPGRRIARRLLFKVLGIERYRPVTPYVASSPATSPSAPSAPR
ncbi:MAG: pyridoxamine 5'-phosphate oxidase family protein [Planctomycetota bacterium]